MSADCSTRPKAAANVRGAQRCGAIALVRASRQGLAGGACGTLQAAQRARTACVRWSSQGLARETALRTRESQRPVQCTSCSTALRRPALWSFPAQPSIRMATHESESAPRAAPSRCEWTLHERLPCRRAEHAPPACHGEPLLQPPRPLAHSSCRRITEGRNQWERLRITSR